MALTVVRREKEDLVMSVPHLQYEVSQEGAPLAYTPTSMTATTVDAAGLGAEAVGKFFVPEDADARDQLRQVLSRAGTVATVDTAWKSVTGVTRVRSWLPGDVPVVTTGSGSTTTLVCSTHIGAGDDFWNDTFLLLCEGGANAGRAVQVTDYTSATGTFTFSPAVTSTVAGELWILRKLQRPMQGSIRVSVALKSVPVPIVGEIDPGASVMTNWESSIGFDLPLRPMVTAAASGVQGKPALELSDNMRDIFVETKDSGATAGAGTPMTGNDLTVVDAAPLSVGGIVLCNNGQAGQIRNKVGNVLTIGASQITAAQVIASSVVHGSVWYKRQNDSTGFRHRTISYWAAGRFLKEFGGAMGKVEIDVARGSLVMFKWDYTASEYRSYNKSRPVADGAAFPIPIVDRTVPLDSKGWRFLMDGTSVRLRSLTLNPNYKPVHRDSLGGRNQGDGYMMDYEDSWTGSMEIYADQDGLASFEAVIDRLRAGKVIDVLYQRATNPKEVFVAAVPCLQLVDAPWEYQDGQGYYSCTWKALKPQAVASTYHTSLPSLVLAQL